MKSRQKMLAAIPGRKKGLMSFIKRLLMGPEEHGRDEQLDKAMQDLTGETRQMRDDVTDLTSRHRDPLAELVRNMRRSRRER